VHAVAALHSLGER